MQMPCYWRLRRKSVWDKEGMRRQDQIRFGTYTEPTTDRYAGVHHNVATGDYVVDNTGFTTVFPIPTSVLELNTKLTQNPGY